MMDGFLLGKRSRHANSSDSVEVNGESSSDVNNSTKRRNNGQSGISRPVQMSEKLSTFFVMPSGSALPRTESMSSFSSPSFGSSLLRSVEYVLSFSLSPLYCWNFSSLGHELTDPL